MIQGSYNIEFNREMRVCKECKKNYIPNAPNQKYCEKCRVIVKDRQTKAAQAKYKKRGGADKIVRQAVKELGLEDKYPELAKESVNEDYESWDAMGDSEFMEALASASVSTLVQLAKVVTGDRLDSVQAALSDVQDEEEEEDDTAGPENEAKVQEGREITVLIEPHMGKKGEILKHMPAHQSQDEDKYLVKVDGAEIYLTDTQFESKVKESKTRDEKDLETYKKRLASLGDAKMLGGERE